MYLKGYQIKYNLDRTINFPKWDFGGDRSFTNKAWNGVLTHLRSLPLSSYPMSIVDLDQLNGQVILINNPHEFEIWINKSYTVKVLDQSYNQ